MNSERRNQLIAKRGYDLAIEGDDLSLKIASYPVSARYLAKRLSSHGRSITELCCGVGISLIEFAKSFDDVVGIDSDQLVIEAARKNVEMMHNVHVRIGDIRSSSVLENIKSDVVIYDIPYWNEEDNKSLGDNPDLKETVEIVLSNVTTSLCIYAPTHMRYEQLEALFGDIEYQEVWINGRHDRNFIYFDSLIESRGRTRIDLSTL